MPITRGTKQATLFGKGGGFLLRDEFTTDLVAGSVNGTAAEPGPGVRTVVDTGNYLSISGDKLDVTDGMAAIWDPRLNYGSFVRQIKSVVVCSVTPVASRGPDMVGWTKVGSGGAVDPRGCFRFTSPVLSVAFLSGGSFVVATYNNGTTYRIAVNTRSVGNYYFITGGAFSQWTLLYFEEIEADANRDISLYFYDGASQVEYIRISDILFLPIPLCFDSFSRADGAPGDSEASGPDSQTTPVRTWIEQSGDWEISSNKLQTAAAAGAGIATVPVGVADVLYQIKITTPGVGTTPGGLVLRYSDTSNYWYLKITPGTAGTDLELVEVNAGVPTTRASADIDWVAATDYAIMVVVEGDDEWRVFVDDVSKFTYTTTNTFNSTATICGVEDEGDSNFQFDDLLVFSRGNDGSFSELDRY